MTNTKRRRFTKPQLIKLLTVALSIIGLYGYVLCRKDVKLSALFQSLGTVAAISYCCMPSDEEINPLTQAWKDLEAERERINNQTIEDHQRFEEERERMKVDHREEMNLQKELALNEQKNIIGIYEHELDILTEQLEIKENMLRQARLPKMAKGISRTETYANRIIGYLYERGIEADYADSWEEYSYDLIRLIPKNTSLKQFKDLADDLQLELRINTPPTFEITQGCIQVRIDTKPSEDSKNSGKVPKLQLTITEWLPEIASRIIHAKVDGETQSGKSTFVSNVANLLATIHGDASEFVAIDPKFPLSLNWKHELQPWQRNPKYQGIETALDGLEELAAEIKSRLELARQDVIAGKEPRSFPKKVYLVDEIDWIMIEYGKPATDLLQVGLKVGAALNVIVIYFGQTPRCSKLKMTKDDFRNSTNISLGLNIPDGINTYVFDDSYGRELLDLYEREINNGNTFICLVAQKGKKPFIAQLPIPNQYKPLSTYAPGKQEGKQEVNLGKSNSQSIDTLNRETQSQSEFTSLTRNLPENLPASNEGKSGKPDTETVYQFTDPRRMYENLDFEDERLSWVNYQDFIRTKGKTYVIEVMLGCKGKYYEKGKAYLEYLEEYYG